MTDGKEAVLRLLIEKQQGFIDALQAQSELQDKIIASYKEENSLWREAVQLHAPEFYKMYLTKKEAQ